MSGALALDIGGTHSRATLLEGTHIVWRAQLPTPAQAGPEAMMATMLQLCAQAPESHGAIGVAIAGAVTGGTVTAHNTGLLQGWSGYPLGATLAQRLGRPVTLFNDARAAAWAEYQLGAGQGCAGFLYVTVSTGVGAGLVLNGRLHLAEDGMDAELGETLLPDGQTLENVASGTALGAQAHRLGHASAAALCSAAEAGDAAALQALNSGIDALARKLADVRVMLGITRCAIGGGLGLRPGYVARLQAAMQQLPPLYHLDLVPATLGADAGLHGVAALVRLAS